MNVVQQASRVVSHTTGGRRCERPDEASGTEDIVSDLCNRDYDSRHVTVVTIGKKPLVDKLKRKFINEARTISRLEHIGIVRVSDVFEENGTAYYVMDYIKGLNCILGVPMMKSENRYTDK